MARIERTASGICRLRQSKRVEGKLVTTTLIRNLGKDEDYAEKIRLRFEDAELLGYRWNPLSQNVVADIDEFLRAKALGIDPNEPAREIKDALELFLPAQKRSAHTREKYRGTVEDFVSFTKSRILADMEVDRVNAWASAMETGALTYTRGGKDKQGKEKRYRYTDTTISIRLCDLRVFCNYCVFRGWMTNDPSNKAKPLNPFSQIKISEPKAGKRYLTRSEVGSLLWACRLDKFKANGNNPIPDNIRGAIIGEALKHPEHGKWTVKRLLEKRGIKVGIGTVDWVWRRNGLASERERKRAAARPGPFVPASAWIVNKKASNRLRLWIHFAFYTGLREGEFRRARCEDIITTQVVDEKSEEARTVYGLQVLQPSKGGDAKIRVIWFSPNVVRIHGIKKKFGARGPLFNVISKSGLAKAMREAVKRARLGRVRFHDLRHSFARNFLLSETGSLSGLQQRLGHSRLSTTGIYSNFAHTDGAAKAKKLRAK
jgi:integrase